MKVEMELWELKNLILSKIGADEFEIRHRVYDDDNDSEYYTWIEYVIKGKEAKISITQAKGSSSKK
ncbi:hypothetical protein IID24_03305 [Patescibacteria group bacterium]|nr:hypothetical protein [Patescibacteria group bacterium]